MSSAGCWGTEGSAELTVNALPSNVSASSSAAGVCSGGSVNLTGSATLSVSGTMGTTEYTGYGENDFPFATYYEDARSEFLYLASDLNAAGISGASDITSIAFNVAANNTQTMNNFSIKM